MREKERQIRDIVKRAINLFSIKFETKHLEQKENENGVINRRIRNNFIAPLGADIQFHSALARSFDSSLGCLIENIARDIARLSFDVEDRLIDGPISERQISKISDLLSEYRYCRVPKAVHYSLLKDSELETTHGNKYVTDFLLKDRTNDCYYLIELKMGGDIDSKKARAEKESLMEQYSVLSNIVGADKEIRCYFATAYNRFGQGNQWKQYQVQQFFSEDELLIGKEFWNFICQDEEGFDIVMSEYDNNAEKIIRILRNIKENYL